MTLLSTFIGKIEAGQDLSEAEAESAILEIIETRASVEEVKAFLLGLRAKGESLSEVVGAARAMRSHATPVKVDRPPVDTCGTGGDGLKTVNISTIAALVVAGAGVVVAKHGNRSVTSSCGSADLLEALGVSVDIEPLVVERSLRETGFGFFFAPRFHPAMKAVAMVRKELGVPTIFNLLGPLTNPVGVRHQVVGVARESTMDLYAQALRKLGTIKALVVHGADGQDELSTTGPTSVIEINSAQDPDRVARYTLVSEMFGIPKARLEDLRGGTPQENAIKTLEVLHGKSGPVRDAVLFNAAAALYVSGEAADLPGGLSFAAQSIDSGRALAVLEKVKEITQRK